MNFGNVSNGTSTAIYSLAPMLTIYKLNCVRLGAESDGSANRTRAGRGGRVKCVFVEGHHVVVKAGMCYSRRSL